jgi:lipoate-protein ligase A
VQDDRERGEPQARVDRDAALLEAVRAGAAPATARVWSNARALCVARADARLAGFEAAHAALARAGWPVVLRESGGTAVPHGPGVVLLSLAFRPPSGTRSTLEATYAALCAPLAAALARLGVPSAPGEAPGSFCGGRFDLLAFGRKIAGTAQRWRARPGAAEPGRGAILCHAALLADLDVADATAAVNRFYAEAGGARRCDATASIDLREALGRAGRPAAAGADVAGAFRDALLAVLREGEGCA